MRSDEFIYIDGQAVRLTSVTRDGEALSFVVIVRGSGSRDELQALLDRSSFDVALGDDPPRRMQVATLDVRSSGEGPTAIHRFAISLSPAPNESADRAADGDEQSALMQRLARIERKLDAILARLDAGGRMPF